MATTKSPAQEFIELIFESAKVQGFDELSSKLIAILFTEPGELTLSELAKKAGYSFSAVSTAMRFLERTTIVTRRSKPGSKKLYYSIEKDIISMEARLLKIRLDKVYQPTLQKLPQILKRYKNTKSNIEKDRLKVIKQYHKQIQIMDHQLKRYLKSLEKAIEGE